MFQYPNKKDFNRLTLSMAGVALVLISASGDLLGQGGTAEIKIETSFTDKPVAATENIELRLKQPLQESDGRLGILIGTTDVSRLFTREGLRLRYNPKLWPLPVGETLVTVYLVSKDDMWREIARFTLQVKEESELARTHPQANQDLPGNSDEWFFSGAAYFGNPKTSAVNPSSEPESSTSSDKQEAKTNNHRMKITPSLTLTVPSQPAQSTFPGPQPERATFIELNMQASMATEVNHGAFTSRSAFEFAGTSFHPEALRFETLGNAAPRVDLAGYQIHFQVGRAKFDVGHFSHGSQRHLINGFSSRGLQVTVPFLKRFDFTAAAMNGTQLVGYDNFFGLSKRRHQMRSGTLGVELIERPGGLRVEVSALNAYFQPISGVNRGVVTDLQRSNGIAIRFIANDKSQRFHFEGGFTRSLFASPDDLSLSQGTTLVALPNLTRNAQYLEMSYEILRNYSLTKTKKANLNVSFREEGVAPLFRSLGASTQADKIQYELSVNGSIDEISAQFGYANFHDNLRRIPSILRSSTASTHLGLAVPASALLNRGRNSAWLPRLGYSFARVHAFGVAIPVNGGFELDLSTVPDLVGTNQTFSADWQVRRFTWGYNINRSFQDNRQTGRESSDQSVLVNTGRVGVAATSRLNLNFDLSAESAANKETGRIDRAYRVGPSITWQLTRHMGVSASLANTIAGDAARTSRSRNTGFDVSWTYRFERGSEGLKRVAGQFFIRYANQYSRAFDRIFAFDTLNKNQTLTANLGITFF